MESVADRRRHTRVPKVSAHLHRLSMSGPPGFPRVEVVIAILDTSDEGCRVKLGSALGVGSTVHVDRAPLRNSSKQDNWVARVMWCSLEPDGSCLAGLHFEEPVRAAAADSSPEQPLKTADYYEILQLNAKADPDTIHRVYRLLAQRFHPDNQDTGDANLFRQLLEAYRVLSDPEQRAAYDVSLLQQNRRRWRIFGQTNALNGREDEKAKRIAILLILYTRRRNEPAQPAMTVHEMEELLGCPKEHLEFCLWYLKEKNWVTRSDNGKFTITASGVEAAEAAEIAWPTNKNYLPAGRSEASRQSA